MTAAHPFDVQPTLKGRGLSLRPLEQADRKPLWLAASDPLIWEQHPSKTRHQRESFDPYFDFLLGRGTTLVATQEDGGGIVGTSSYYFTPETPPAPSIGFTFLIRSLWGGPANREMKALMLDHMFQSVETAWFHIGPDNQRSLLATQKLGAQLVRQDRLDLGTGTSDYLCLRLDRADWQP
jgi:RimJ/RimL family protein N-acetyltransferase